MVALGSANGAVDPGRTTRATLTAVGLLTALARVRVARGVIRPGPRDYSSVKSDLVDLEIHKAPEVDDLVGR